MAVRSLHKLPKRKVTVDELLVDDQITDLLADLADNRHNIQEFMVVYVDKDDRCHRIWHGDNDRILYALECAKWRLMRECAEDA